MNFPRFLRRLFREPFDGLRHFGIVEEGGLYRCGQPRPDQLERLIADHGLKTIVSLRGTRGDEDPDAWEAAEREVCERHGVAFVSIPCNHRNPPTDEQFARFLELVQTPERRPALVHCRLGQQRTLLFCALYRIHAMGVDPQVALRDMDALGFGAHKRRHRLLLDSFHRLARLTLPRSRMASAS